MSESKGKDRTEAYTRVSSVAESRVTEEHLKAVGDVRLVLNVRQKTPHEQTAPLLRAPPPFSTVTHEYSWDTDIVSIAISTG